ncbi:conjugal transfer protein [Nocardiopsis changdeensis]|uniref:Conjugal transfer protein n=1 Tax=Nocardiopsis changdeensis TaxID=2831969 RepID=A0A975KUU1_9ACTN|nr:MULTISPECIES: conjugal transfer protein [Nocardiopsis]QUX26421.1 conjugal transfer protein [Nocardiopsis changdeensis]QYX40693.1 conjugal transfer protein [Nocardiopsis sp. MT53]
MSPTPPTETPARPRRSGTGGRWWIYAGRGIIWAFFLAVIVNAAMNQYRLWTADAAPVAEQAPAAAEPATAFPEDAAAAFAQGFAQAYFSQGADADEAPAVTLADYVPEDRLRDFAVPEMTVDGIRTVQVNATDDHHGIVTLAAQVGGAPMHLDVPIYAADTGALVVSGLPALLPAPEPATLPAPAEEQATDEAAAEQMTPVITGFLEAWAETPDHLPRYLSPQAQVDPLPEGAFTFGGLGDLTVPPVDGDGPREALATVTWRPAEETDGGLTQHYRITLEQTAGNWFVVDVQGAPAPPAGS